MALIKQKATFILEHDGDRYDLRQFSFWDVNTLSSIERSKAEKADWMIDWLGFVIIGWSHADPLTPDNIMRLDQGTVKAISKAISDHINPKETSLDPATPLDKPSDAT